MRDFTLPELGRHLHDQYGDAAPNYVRLHRTVAAGRIPAMQRGKMWFVAESDLDTARRALNLPELPAQGGLGPSPRKKNGANPGQGGR